MQQVQLQEPSQTTIFRVLEILEQHGVMLDPGLIRIIIMAHDAYLFETKDGITQVINRCKMDHVLGESDMEYRIVDTHPPVAVNGDDVYFFNAVVVKGQFCPPGHVDSYHVDKNACDDCGGSFHCSIKTKDEMGKDLVICNKCASSSSITRIRDLGKGTDFCRTCSVEKCSHHPMKALNAGWVRQGVTQ